MVRFKNRHILVEFLQPGQLLPSFTSNPSIPPFNTFEHDELDDEDEDDVLPVIPEIPFLLPLPSLDGSSTPLGMGDEGGQAVYKAVRGVVQEVYGDEGWGRIASSFKGEPFSNPNFSGRVCVVLTYSHLPFTAYDFDNLSNSSIALPASLVRPNASYVNQQSTDYPSSGSYQRDYQEASKCSDSLSSKYHGADACRCVGSEV